MFHAFIEEILIMENFIFRAVVVTKENLAPLVTTSQTKHKNEVFHEGFLQLM